MPYNPASAELATGLLVFRIQYNIDDGSLGSDVGILMTRCNLASPYLYCYIGKSVYVFV